ncbi:N-acetylmuramoyl-L-alanine amidase family protein [Anaeromyxobacter paludicola]|uniref:N-acetylmuramoyl-L-alanine amidase family protein n=1 Tax=Anaeromyxobacter paludicola TaxID=2918171 RepID=UPI0020BF787A|nr:N-acetylmuramoyl-L-alanine amidase [Anaeromyxobacter paludicola]
MSQIKRDPARRRYRHHWEKAIASLERAAVGRDAPVALLEAAHARYALYRFSAVEADRDQALRLAARARKAGSTEAAAFAAAIRREAGRDEPSPAPAVARAARPRAPFIGPPPPPRAARPEPSDEDDEDEDPVLEQAVREVIGAPAPAQVRTPLAPGRTGAALALPTPAPRAEPSPFAPRPADAATPVAPTAPAPPPAPKVAGVTAPARAPAEPPERVAGARPGPAPSDGEGEGDARPVRRIIVDAGHGGHDTGAIGPRGVREKDVTLQIAERLARKLRAASFQVVLTRSDDRFVSLAERTAIANGAKGDLFVSVHANAHPRRDRAGVESWVLNVSDDRYANRLAARENGAFPEEQEVGEDLAVRRILADLDAKVSAGASRKLARLVQREVCAGVRARVGDVRDLGVKSALFYVLVGARMPAVLVETAFISNKVEEQRLQSARYQDEVAQAISRAVVSYTGRDDRVAAAR